MVELAPLIKKSLTNAMDGCSKSQFDIESDILLDLNSVFFVNSLATQYSSYLNYENIDMNMLTYLYGDLVMNEALPQRQSQRIPFVLKSMKNHLTNKLSESLPTFNNFGLDMALTAAASYIIPKANSESSNLEPILNRLLILNEMLYAIFKFNRKDFDNNAVPLDKLQARLSDSSTESLELQTHAFSSLLNISKLYLNAEPVLRTIELNIIKDRKNNEIIPLFAEVAKNVATKHQDIKLSPKIANDLQINQVSEKYCLLMAFLIDRNAALVINQFANNSRPSSRRRFIKRLNKRIEDITQLMLSPLYSLSYPSTATEDSEREETQQIFSNRLKTLILTLSNCLLSFRETADVSLDFPVIWDTIENTCIKPVRNSCQLQALDLTDFYLNKILSSIILMDQTKPSIKDQLHLEVTKIEKGNFFVDLLESKRTELSIFISKSKAFSKWNAHYNNIEKDIEVLQSIMPIPPPRPQSEPIPSNNVSPPSNKENTEAEEEKKNEDEKPKTTDESKKQQDYQHHEAEKTSSDEHNPLSPIIIITISCTAFMLLVAIVIAAYIRFRSSHHPPLIRNLPPVSSADSTFKKKNLESSLLFQIKKGKKKLNSSSPTNSHLLTDLLPSISTSTGLDIVSNSIISSPTASRAPQYLPGLLTALNTPPALYPSTPPFSHILQMGGDSRRSCSPPLKRTLMDELTTLNTIKTPSGQNRSKISQQHPLDNPHSYYL